MNKEDILKISRQENKSGDEREKTIESRASQNAYIAIMGVFLILAVIAFIQEILTGHPFIDFKICSLAFVLGIAGRYMTFYIYHKDKTNLFISLGAICLSILYITRLIWS